MSCKPENHSETKFPEVPQGPQKASAAQPLGTYGSIVGRSDTSKPWQERREALYRLQRTAVSLLFPAGTPAAEIKGTGTCRWAVQSKTNGVDVMMSHYEETGQDRASFKGLQNCGAVWTCPVCAQRISETRRKEMNVAMKHARDEKLLVKMATYTSQHSIDDDLQTMLQGMKDAKRALEQRRDYKKFKADDLVGSIVATEVTHGKNGWHVHFHVIYFLRTKAGADFLGGLGDAWRTALRGVGLDGADAAFDCQNAENAAGYVAKWGAAEELTLSGKKKAKKGGMNPLQLLEAYAAGNEEAGELWLEYSKRFHGRNQLSWSRGLKALMGVDDVSDEDAAGDEVQDDQEQEEDPLMNISHSDWRATGRYRRTRILDAAEVEGAKGIDAVLSEPWSKDLTDDVIDDADECPAKQARNDAARRVMDNLIAEIDDAMKPKPGGLAERALSLVRKKDDKPQRHVMTGDRGKFSKNEKQRSHTKTRGVPKFSKNEKQPPHVMTGGALAASDDASEAHVVFV